MAKTFKITLKRSTIGCTQDQIRTVASLGLRRRGDVVDHADNPATRGQIFKVQHLLDVTIGKATEKASEKTK